MSDITIIKVIEHGPQGVPGEATPEFLGLVAQVTTDKGLVAADKAAVSADRGAVAVDKLAVANDRTLADASALVASQALGLLADSTTSLAIATGDKTFTAPTGKSFAAGMPVRASSKANPDTQAMIGVVKSYSGSTLVVAVASVVGSATRADWTIAVTGGALAPVGQTQDAQAIAELGRLERSLAAAGVPDESSLILDFIRGVHFASKAAITASILTLIAALPGSISTRASTGTYFDSDGLLKTAANNVPRIEYDPVTRLPLGLLMEPARTNNLLRSQEVDHGAWVKTNTTVTADAAISPDGLSTSDALIETVTNAGHSVAQSTGLTKAVVYAVSVFVKANGRTRGILQHTAYSGDTLNVQFDLVAGTVGSVSSSGTAVAGGTAGIMPVGDGWFRVWLVGQPSTAVGTGTNVSVGILNASGQSSYAGDGTSGLFVWGAQIEAGSEPSSYIPTVASTVTRAADALTIGGGSWLPATGVLSGMVEFDTAAVPTSTAFAVSIRDASGNNSVNVRVGIAAGDLDFYTLVGTGQVNSAGLAIVPNTPLRAAFGLEATSWAFGKDGAAPLTGGATTLPVGLDRLGIGANGFMGHIRRILFFPQRLSNAKVQALSGNAWS